jgi:hypothetical protein
LKIHAIIFCWPGKVPDAQRICASISTSAEKVTVIDASTDPLGTVTNCEWIRISPDAYFGHQFVHALRVFEHDVMLQIQADASHPDWGAVVKTCRQRFEAMPELGIWAPDIDFTTWPTRRVKLFDTGDPELVGVVQSDCIVWALKRPVVEYLKKFDYSNNNLGYGIDWAAIAHCYANKALVLRDLSLRVLHPQGSGYDREEAHRQMWGFLHQMARPDRVQFALLWSFLSGRDAMLQKQA